MGDTLAMSESNAVFSEPGLIPNHIFDATGKHLSSKSKKKPNESPKNSITERRLFSFKDIEKLLFRINNEKEKDRGQCICTK